MTITNRCTASRMTPISLWPIPPNRRGAPSWRLTSMSALYAGTLNQPAAAFPVVSAGPLSAWTGAWPPAAGQPTSVSRFDDRCFLPTAARVDRPLQQRSGRASLLNKIPVLRAWSLLLVGPSLKVRCSANASIPGEAIETFRPTAAPSLGTNPAQGATDPSRVLSRVAACCGRDHWSRIHLALPPGFIGPGNHKRTRSSAGQLYALGATPARAY